MAATDSVIATSPSSTTGKEPQGELGLDAVCHLAGDNTAPRFFGHRAPIQSGNTIRPDDILVFPDDNPLALASAARLGRRTVVFSQGVNSLGATAFEALEVF